jgi:hypothetical protein
MSGGEPAPSSELRGLGTNQPSPLLLSRLVAAGTIRGAPAVFGQGRAAKDEAFSLPSAQRRLSWPRLGVARVLAMLSLPPRP